jgi:excinuclease ABC subunit A
VVREIGSRLKFLNDVGLNYLSLDRSAESLSGGEAQRIRLASQIGSGLTGVMYVLDEPSIGLHQRDNDRLIGTLKHLRDIGNSVLVVEHDEDMIRAADHVIDMGPGAGVHGGRVMAQGTAAEVEATPASVTGHALAGTRPRHRAFRSPAPRAGGPEGAPGAARGERHRQQPQGRDVEVPVGLLTCVTGVSGSGKSTLVNDTLYAAAARQIHRAHTEPAAHEEILGMEHFDKVINVDQSPIGRTPRSNPATYTGLFTPIRELMAEVPTAASAATARALQLQRGRRALRGLPGRRHGEGGDALPARCLRALRHLPRPALQPRDARSAVEGQEHRPDPGHDGGGRARLLPRRAHAWRASCTPCWTWA